MPRRTIHHFERETGSEVGAAQSAVSRPRQMLIDIAPLTWPELSKDSKDSRRELA